MNATNVVSFLLELNVIGTEDIDMKLRKIAARIANPDARAWFMRVPRYFLINLDKQASTPYTLPQRANRLLAFKEPGNMQSKPVTNLHRDSVEQEISRTFEPYNPAKPPKKQLYKGPPAEVADWMKAAKDRKDNLYFFDPYNKDQISFDRLQNIANWFNFIPQDSPVFRTLRTMRFDDIEGFREINQQAQEWGDDAKDKPWKFRKMTGYEYGGMSVIACNDVEKSMEIARGTSLCTRMSGHAKGYLEDGLLYYVFVGSQLFACIHVPSNQVRDTTNRSLDDDEMRRIAPLFKHIPVDYRMVMPQYRNATDIRRLSAAIEQVPEEVEPTPIENEKTDAEQAEFKVKRRLPPFNDEPARDTGYRPSHWGESLASYVAGLKF